MMTPMPRDSSSLDQLLENPRLWRGRNPAQGMAGLASGYEKLDRHLPGGGWPRHALTEILTEHYGIGELRLLMPALARLSAEDNGRRLIRAGLDCLGGTAVSTLSTGIAAVGHRSVTHVDRAAEGRQRNALVGRTGIVIRNLCCGFVVA